MNVLSRGKIEVGRLGSIWPVISKLKVNTGLFTNDLVNFPHIYFGLLYLRREILNVFATGPYQSNSNTGTTYHLKMLWSLAVHSDSCSLTTVSPIHFPPLLLPSLSPVTYVCLKFLHKVSSSLVSTVCFHLSFCQCILSNTCL